MAGTRPTSTASNWMRLSQTLEQFRKEPTPANEVALANQLAIVRAVGQAPELVKAVRAEFGRPNVYMDMSSELLKAAAEPINRSEANHRQHPGHEHPRQRAHDRQGRDHARAVGQGRRFGADFRADTASRKTSATTARP